MTFRDSSKSPGMDRNQWREQAKQGRAKPGYKDHSRVLIDDPQVIVDHRPVCCACCGGTLHGGLPAGLVSMSKRINLPAVAPVVTNHRRPVVQCPTSGSRVVALVPEDGHGMPFDQRQHAMTTYLKAFQVLCYKWLQVALLDLLGLTLRLFSV